MRLDELTGHLGAIANAGAILTPIQGRLQSTTTLFNAFTAADMPDDSSGDGVILVEDGVEVLGAVHMPVLHNVVFAIIAGHLNPRSDLHKFREAHGLSQGDENSPITSLLYPIDDIPVVLPSEPYRSVLQCFADQNAELLLVQDEATGIIGSIALHDLLKWPGLFWVLSKSLELEAATLEYFSIYPDYFKRLKEKRQCDARKLFEDSPRRKELDRKAAMIGTESLSDHVKLREYLQYTTMCDKKELAGIVAKEGVLPVSKNVVDRAFNFAEKVRNYSVHPRASFTMNLDEADFLAKQNHEATLNERECDVNLSWEISEAVGVCSVEYLVERIAAIESVCTEFLELKTAAYKNRE